MFTAELAILFFLQYPHKTMSIQTIIKRFKCWLLTKVISVVVPALIASALLLVQSFFSIFIIFLSQVFILQNFIGTIDLQELLVGCGVTLK